MSEEKTFAANLEVEAYTADELEFTFSGEYDAIPEDKMNTSQAVEENIKNAAAAMIAANIQKAKAEGPKAEAGTVISGYEYVDIVCATPVKKFKPTSPPYTTHPHKVIGAGEEIRHRAFLLINPLPGPQNTPSGIMVLGDRPLRVQFSLMNVTTVEAGSTGTWTGTFSGLAPTLVTFYWDITHNDPGPNPHVYELNVTFDCGDPDQPYAAFATRWWDGDTDPGWPWHLPGPTIPPVFPQWRNPVPLRYLVYRK
jgi:hypothetical protein